MIQTMRKLQISLFTFLTAVAFFACKKETDQILSFDQLGIGSYIFVDKANSTEFNFAQIGTSSVSWDGHIVGEAADRVISYVSSSNNSANKTTWKKIKETPIADGKVTISVTGGQVATALGVAPTSLAPGSQYVIYNEVVTKSGKVYNYNNTNAEVEAAAAYSMGLRLFSTITCPFEPAGFAGDFEVISDGWADYAAGDIVKITSATATSVVLDAYPSPSYNPVSRNPITVTINPANGRATVARQTYGSYPPEIAAATTAARASYIFSCTGDVILYLIHTGPSGSPDYGTYLLRLKKK